jgi:hypothetical protein
MKLLLLIALISIGVSCFVPAAIGPTGVLKRKSVIGLYAIAFIALIGSILIIAFG